MRKDRGSQVFRVDDACSQKQGKQAAKTFLSITATALSNSKRVHLQNSRKNGEGTQDEK